MCIESANAWLSPFLATGRASSQLWGSFINSFYLTAHFSEEDYVSQALFVVLASDRISVAV